MKFFLLLTTLFFCAGCGTEPNIHNTIGGKMMKRVSAFTTYANNSPTNLFYSAVTVDGTVYAGTDCGFFVAQNDQMEAIALDGLDTKVTVRVFRLCAAVDAHLGKVIYVATAKGLYRYTFADKKTKWLQTDAKDSGRLIQFLSVFVDEQGVIYAGTYKNGIYISEDGGSSWIHHLPSDFKLYRGQKDLTYDGYKKAAAAEADFVDREGIIKIEPHYRGAMKSSTVTDITVYDGRIYAATFGGGLSYTLRPASFVDWEPYWITYLRPWYFFEAESDERYGDTIEKNREEEVEWTLKSRYLRRVSVQPFGIFVASDDGISFTSHGERFGDRDTCNTVVRLDDFGRRQPILNDHNGAVNGGGFGLNENEVAAWQESSRFQTWQTVRVWHEYTSDGSDRFADFSNEKEVKYIEEYTNGMVGAGLESDNFNALRFGQINNGKTKLFYTGTECGLSISQLRDYTDVTGQTYTSSDLVDSWVTYHNVLSVLEETWVYDIAVETDADGNDKTVYVASNGQGLIVFRWED